MDRTERIKLVKAMEYVARQVNDEEVFWAWLESGVGDGDIDYGDLSELTNDADFDYYCEDEHFSELMGLFLRTMGNALKSGGICCDGVTDDNNN